jgi:hypothetical protein
MKRIVAALMTIALMGLLLWSGSRKGAGPAGPGTDSNGNTDASNRTGSGRSTNLTISTNVPDPAEVRLKTLLDAAWRGDVAAYLDGFGGPLRERLRREVDERGRDVFAADLKRAARSRKSHAIFGVEPEGQGAARITVETVYPDRNERQTYHLTQEPSAGGWLVTDVETIRSQVPKARYGTMASYQEPEGVPVQGLAVQGIPLRVETDLKAGGTAPAPPPDPNTNP